MKPFLKMSQEEYDSKLSELTDNQRNFFVEYMKTLSDWGQTWIHVPRIFGKSVYLKVFEMAKEK
jgi:hypothetical protein